ncbi:catalase-like domain-containing protein [Papiliotrema laurentii]|uniref:Catalase n=1 Tax=Papiliotrema laurentii TaxID=5418 RepID=A0AAD9FTN1_PAPLA|nr:catalase-like domain-containing protein [Papiliotrema laurentii]
MVSRSQSSRSQAGQSAPLSKAYEADRDAQSRQAIYTTSNGAPVSHPYSAQRAGVNGPLLLQDFHLIDLLSHFDRERIPERVVHAKGSGAHGYFECTDGLEDVSVANLFQKGVQCPITVRFSTVGGESGSPDLARDPRGFAVKFRTAEGNWDFVGNNTPVFFLRDPAKFPHFIHTQKRHPATHLGGGDDSTMFWDYLSNNPEAIHQVMILMSDRGIPAGWRHMHGHYGHTLKLVQSNGEWIYAQFHLISDQGTANFTAEEAAERSPDWGQKDLYEAIERGDCPSWTMKVQLMTRTQAEEAWAQRRINVFDLTHVWPHADYPLRTVGRLVLNENAKNYFAEIEQAAFNPAHMVPGIEPSADPVLQSRLFSYPDAHRHRIGANYQQLPVNQHSTSYPTANFQRDGQMAFLNQGARPAYLSSIDPVQFKPSAYDLNKVHGAFIGEAVSYLSEIRPEDFNAPRNLWEKVFSEESRARFVKTASGHMSTCKDKTIIARQLAIFRQVSEDLSTRLEKATGVKAYSGRFEDLTFNGSHNGYGKKKTANGMQTRSDVVFDNGAPVRSNVASRL